VRAFRDKLIELHNSHISHKSLRQILIKKRDYMRLKGREEFIEEDGK